MLAMQKTTAKAVAPDAPERPDNVVAQRKLLRPGRSATRNAWRVAPATRATVLIDAANYFGALRQAMLQARHSIYIIGWDVDSRTPLVGPSGEVDDDLPRELGPFLSALSERSPRLQIKILLWDYSLFFTSEREAMPAFALRWRMPPQIDLCLDDAIPLGSSHHQKIVIVDEIVAFSGGLDLTIRRWDNSDHDPANPQRVDPAGKPYRPFHDIQMAIEGEAAQALTELARKRWARAACERLPRIDRAEDEDSPWPRELEPDFRNVEIGISRTEPPYSDQRESREVERLFHDMTTEARQTIYVESQYIACARFARSLAEALRRRPQLEAVLVTPRTYKSLMERSVMLAGRARVMRILRKAGVANRVLMAAPRVRHKSELIDVSVHAKLMIVDDRYLRVGSANLCNRSMGADTECDLTVSGERSARTRAAIAGIRSRLIAEHCGAGSAEVEAALAEHGSLIAAINALPRRAHALHRIGHDDPAKPIPAAVAAVAAVADPVQPIDPTRYVSAEGVAVGRSRRRPLLAAAGILMALAVVLGLSLAWTMTPLAEWTDPALWEGWLQSIDAGWAALAVIALFVLSGLVVFPVTVMIAVTAAIFGAWPGFLYAAAGTLASALVTYGLGHWLGVNGLRQFFGPRINFLARSFAKRGIPAVTLVRLVPVAPFSLINLAAGAIRIPVLDYTAGTVLGLAPGLALMSLLGHNVTEMLRAPTFFGIATVIGVVLGAIALSMGAQRLVTRRRGPRRRRGTQTQEAKTSAEPV